MVIRSSRFSLSYHTQEECQSLVCIAFTYPGCYDLPINSGGGARNQLANPILPLDTVVPDAEAHVWADGRIYLYGSLDLGAVTANAWDGYPCLTVPDPTVTGIHSLELCFYGSFSRAAVSDFRFFREG